MKTILFAIIIGATLITPSLSVAQDAVPSLDKISQLAISAIEKRLTVPDNAKVIITPQLQQSRLNPPVCTPPLTAEIATDRAIKRNNTVKISCHSPELNYPWQIYISVKVSILYPVVVAKKLLSKGELLSNQNITIEYIEQSHLRGEQFINTAPIIGTRVKRRIPSGKPIFAANICFVCKGDSVSIFARSSDFEIKTSGEALKDGNLGDRISVRNTLSNRKIDAKVSGVGQVEVRM